MRPLLWSLVACAMGCGGVRGPEPIANRAGPSHHACTDEMVAKLTGVLATRWRVATLDLRCVAGTFDGVPSYFVEAQRGDRVRTGVVDASGAEIVEFVDEPERERATFVNGYVAADLDGDGNDEIVESWRREAYGSFGSNRWLAVRRIHRGQFARIRGPHLSVWWPKLGGCHATWNLVRHAIVVAVQPMPGIPPTDCLPPGTHRFALRGSKIEESSR